MAKRYEKKKEAARIAQQQQAREQRRRQLILGGTIVGVVLVLAAVVGVGFYLNQGYPVNKPKAEIEDGGVVLSEGPITVDLYEDFICPACKSFTDQNGEQLDKYAADGEIALRFHPLGLLDNMSSTKYSSRSAAASVCAADEDKFSEYKTSLFAEQPPENGPGLTDEKLIEIGEKAKIGGSFSQCVKDEKYRGWVDEQTQKATGEGVTSTPMVKVDGKKVETANLMQLLDEKIGAGDKEKADDGKDSGDSEEGKEEDDSSSD